METFEAIPKKWGNSLGIVIPKNIAKKEGITPEKKVTVMLRIEDENPLKELFGTLKFKKTTDELMREIDEGWE